MRCVYKAMFKKFRRFLNWLIGKINVIIVDISKTIKDIIKFKWHIKLKHKVIV